MPRTLSPMAIENFRERLRRIAADLFVEAGHDGFNMRELAKRVGVSAMTPYRYFSDKDEILASICTEAFARLADRLNSAQENRDSVAEKIFAMAGAYLNFAASEPNCYRLMFDFSRPRRHSYPDLETQQNRVFVALTELMSGIACQMRLDADPELMAHMLWATMHGSVALRLADHGAIPPEQLVGETIRLLVADCNGDPSQSRKRTAHADDDSMFPPHTSRKLQSVQPGFEALTAAE